MSDNITDDEFQKIDEALELYYTQNNVFYHRSYDGISRFMQYIIDEQLNDPEVPIDNELGSECDPNDCAYTWMNNNDPFPLPNDVQIPQQSMEQYKFYILQHCWKYNKPPTNEYIKQYILPKVPGTSTTATPSTDQFESTRSANTDNNSTMDGDTKQDDNTNEGVPNEGILIIQRISKKPFHPKYSARAHLNIYTAKEMTTLLLGIIDEPFKNELHLYYYTDISAALQMNDNQVYLYTVLINGEEHEFGIINYDFHNKQTGEVLYGIFVPNDDCKIQQDKWLWKLDEFLTRKQILNRYDVQRMELPLSSRKMVKFERELEGKLVIHEKLIDDTDWFSVQQIKSLKRNIKIPKIGITLSREMWIKECKKSFQNIDLPLIPVVVNKNNKHWIEWIKIIHVSSQNVYIGISCKYNKENDEWKVQSICLDRGDIYNKHRLVGLIDNKYSEQLRNFKTSITEIKFSDNLANDIDKKINVLKQQITSQQDSIVRLKENILRVKNRNKYINNNNHNNYAMDAIHVKPFDIAPEPLMEEEIAELMRCDDQDNMMENDGQDPLSQIVDDVIKKYRVLPFKTNPIGAKRNIYINKQFTKSWINYVSPRFNDEAMMYYWLDYTTAIQMIQGYGKQYVDKINGMFICAVINYELKDNQNNNLYGIIFADDTKDKNNDKYPYKLATLMTAEHIHREFGINGYDLPSKSRKHNDFIQKLILKRKILKQDLNQIRWANLKLFKSQSNNTDPVNKSVTMTRNVMKEYINISIERINNDNDNDRKRGNNLIPILVIDKHNNYYGIEWVLIVHIIHRNCYVGVSFRYNTNKNLFIATSIYLDKGEIESKHKLIGLKYDYCQNIASFSLKKLKFKADKNAFIDDDDDVAVYNNNNNNMNMNNNQNDKSIIIDHKVAVEEYQKLIEKEQMKHEQLQQEMVNQHQAYLQEIENIKQENEQYLLQIQQQQHQQQQQQHVMYQQQQQQQQQYYMNNNGMNMNQYYNGF